jgi:hypothetical protein
MTSRKGGGEKKKRKRGKEGQRGESKSDERVEKK